MKILITVHHFPPHYKGGAEWRAYRTAQELTRRGHQVKVVCIERIDAATGRYGSLFPYQKLTWEDEVYDGLMVRRLFFNLGDAPDTLRWEYDNPWIGEHFKKLLAEFQPDVFHMIGGYLITASALRVAIDLSIPTVVSLTDFWFLCKRVNMLRSNGQLSTLPINTTVCARCLGEEKRRFRWPGKLLPSGLVDLFWRYKKSHIKKVESRQRFLKDTLNRVDVIISPSQFLRQAFISEGIRQDRIIYSRQGRTFPKSKTGEVEKSTPSSIRVGYIGQIAKIKGLHILFQAVLALPDIPLKVMAYGDTSPFPAYTRFLQRFLAKDSRLALCGPYPSEELSHVLSGLDLLVVPSLWYENSPNVILEAFSHHVPVIASNLGGMAELVHHEINGLLFNPGNPLDLANQIRRIIMEPGLLAKLSSGIEPVKSLADEMQELEEIYCRVVKANARQCEV